MAENQNVKDMLMELDRQFDKTTSTGGVDAWVSYFAHDGVMVVSQGEDIKGREEIRKSMEGAFSLPGFSLRWEPIDASVSNDGSLGYTYGKYVRRYLDKKGVEIISTGKYTTVWQRQEDNSWRVILDIGN